MIINRIVYLEFITRIYLFHNKRSMMNIHDLLTNWQESAEKANISIEDGECNENLFAVAGMYIRSRIQAGDAVTAKGDSSCWDCTRFGCGTWSAEFC